MIYLDNNATTAIAPEVIEEMLPFLSSEYGNPSSAHSEAETSRLAIETARLRTARFLGASDPEEIVFTSGGTESDNWAIFGTLEAFPEKKKIITTRVEHEAIRRVCEKLERNGYEIVWLDVNTEGMIDEKALLDNLDDSTALVSIMMANNETGVLFPVDDLSKLVKERSKALFHVDGVNAAGKIPIDVASSNIDLFSISAHKFHGPKGVGALYVRNGVNIASNSIGGGQESGRRAGTEAVHQIVGLGAAAKFAADFSSINKIRSLRDGLEECILETFEGVSINGQTSPRLPNTSNLSFEGLNGELILARLDNQGVCVSTGSACNEAEHVSSPVLRAMNIPYSAAMGAIRFSFGRFNTEEELQHIFSILPGIIDEAKRISM